MAVTAASFKERFSEFASEADTRVNLFLSEALTHVSADVLGQTLADQAQSFLAAHLMKLDKRRGASGPVMSETVGPVSRSFAVAQDASKGELGATAYGQQFKRLINLRAAGAMVV